MIYRQKIIIILKKSYLFKSKSTLVLILIYLDIYNDVLRFCVMEGNKLTISNKYEYLSRHK